MSEEKLSNIEKKKQELEKELTIIQNGIDQSIDDVKKGVSTNLDPKNLIKKYPLPLVGASVVVGFLLGKARNKSSETTSRYYEKKGHSNSAIAKEIKRMVAKKGLSLLLDYIDTKVASLKDKKNNSEG